MPTNFITGLGRNNGTYKFGGGKNDIYVNDTDTNITQTVSIPTYGTFNVRYNINGGGGDDNIVGNAANDYLYGGTGDDRLVGADGNDVLVGGPGNDQLYGDSSSVQIGDDVLVGGPGEDLLEGGLGNDILDGGSERDQMYGGSGADTFRFNRGDQVPTPSGLQPRIDAIMDFEASDRVVVYGFVGLGGGETAKFVLTGSFDGIYGPLGDDNVLTVIYGTTAERTDFRVTHPDFVPNYSLASLFYDTDQKTMYFDNDYDGNWSDADVGGVAPVFRFDTNVPEGTNFSLFIA